MYVPRSKVNIFIVDDNKMFSLALKAVIETAFENMPMAIYSFDTGESCMNSLMQIMPELIILDYCLNSLSPDAANGLNVLDMIKKSDFETDVIMLSSNDHIDIALKSFHYGASDYIIKGVSQFKIIIHSIEDIFTKNELELQNKEKDKQTNELLIVNRELKKTEEQFRLVVESTPNAMVLVDDLGCITFVNKRAEKLFQYERSELLGKQIEMLIPERFGEKHVGHRHGFREKPQMRTMGGGSELFVSKKDGTETQVEIGLNPIETSHGKMILASIIDITERKIQEETQIKQLELEIRNKELEQFAYIASHDLQEPLRTISNYMHEFETNYFGQLDEDAHKYIYAVNDAAKRMSTLIKSLLDFARLGLHKKLIQADCKKIINDVIADLDIVIKKSGAILDVAEMPALNVYETEIRQVFQNLITNAIKFRAKDTVPRIQIRSERINEGWKFSVSDNGIGIAPAHFKKVFDIFRRLHGDDQYEGSGIGLANCKKIIQLHQGRIWIESIVGQGTIFYFIIPNLSI